MKEKEFDNTQLKRFLKISFFIQRLKLHSLFHLYTLVLILSLCIFFAVLPSWLAWTDIGLIFTSLWVQLAQAFFIRFNIGLADKYPRAYTLNYNWEKLGQKLPTVTKKDLTKQTITFVIGLTLTAILGYSAIYFKTSILCADFFGNTLSRVDSIYFSVVSFTTVGYGDIAPKDDYSKIIVASEIIYSLATLAVLVLSFSLTHSDEQK